MPKKTKESKKRITISADSNFRITAVMATLSVILLTVTVGLLIQLGFFHMLGGLAIPKAKPYRGVISQDNQVTSVPSGELRFRLNDDIVFKNSYGKGSLMFENPEACEYVLEFSIYRQNDRNNAVYVSPKIQPGECLIDDKLDKHLKKGSYPCICIVRAYDENGKYYGCNIVDVGITIESN
ncbi:MAG TPA: hypothetical protein DDY98_05025 [Ruminococcaceae bacterium]|nr:hypothetical protein [Oscillospiraceae bacterium]